MVTFVRTSVFFVIALVTLGSSSVFATEEQAVVELTHWWRSPGELRALEVIKDAIESKGAKFEATSLRNFNDHRAAIIEQTSLGYFPASTHWLGGKELLELKQEDILVPLNKFFDGEKAKNILFKEVLTEITQDDELAALPVGIHIWNTAYYNAKIYDGLKLSPPTSWEELIEQARIIKKNGYIPLAISTPNGDGWQLNFIVDDILQSVGTPENYNELFDESISFSESRDLLLKAFTLLASLREFSDSSHRNYSWDQNTRSVARGEAAIQIMGDFALGELMAEKKIPGKDFYCSMSPGTQGHFFYGVDIFALLKVTKSALNRGQQILVDTVLDPTVQSDFISRKGGLPVRNDVDTAMLNVCTRKIYTDWVNNPNLRIPLPAGRNRLRMTLISNASVKIWKGEEADIESVVDRLIKSVMHNNPIQPSP